MLSGGGGDSTSARPTLGTEDQLQAPTNAATQTPEEGSWSDNGHTLTLPQRSGANSEGPLSPDEHVGILKAIGRLAGCALGFSDPNSSPQAATGSRIGGLAARLGAGLAMAAGTPEQKQLAQEQLQVPLK